MTIRNEIVSFLAVCSVSCAAGLGCQHAPAADARYGTIDFVVRESQSAPTGSFEVRGLDNAERARIGIGRGTARTLHVQLPAGAYSVAWNPAAPSDTERAKSADGTEQQWPQVVVVTPAGASVVDVLTSSKSARPEGHLALASENTTAAL